MNQIINYEKINIDDMIYEIRGKQVMLDSDLAKLYNIETGALNRQVKRNIKRFPSDFMFQLNDIEYENLKCQNGISSQNNNYGGEEIIHMFSPNKVCQCYQVYFILILRLK